MIRANIEAAAPGKILWIGGYSVLEKPSVSFVTAVSARVRAYVGEAEKNIIECPQFGIKKEIKKLSDDERQKAKFLLAAANSVNAYAKAKGIKEKTIKIKTISDEEFSVEGGKSGLGSSAAVTTATVAALLHLYELYDIERVHKLAQYAHAIAQEKVGSGFDIASATHGTIKYIRYSPSLIDMKESSIDKIIDKRWDYEIKQIEWPSDFRVIVGNFIGKSASTTQLVKKVMEFKKTKPVEYGEIIKEINDANCLAIDALESKDYEKFAHYFNKGRLLTKKLGEESGADIEPAEFTVLIEKIIKEGDALVAKLPGAGGGDSIAAICLNEESERKTKRIIQNASNIKILNIKIENQGVVVK